MLFERISDGEAVLLAGFEGRSSGNGFRSLRCHLQQKHLVQFQVLLAVEAPKRSDLSPNLFSVVGVLFVYYFFFLSSLAFAYSCGGASACFLVYLIL